MRKTQLKVLPEWRDGHSVYNSNYTLNTHNARQRGRLEFKCIGTFVAAALLRARLSSFANQPALCVSGDLMTQ